MDQTPNSVFNEEQVSVTLTLQDVKIIQKCMSHYLAKMSQAAELENYYDKMKPIVDEMSETQWKIDVFEKQLLNLQTLTQNEQSEHL
ncbi:MAG: hypothetical protein [Microviridae sp.]|nr:MAG: hypothetical protein [Microviridae sp.]